MTGPAADPGLTPELPGVTDKTNIRDWNPPFPFDNSRIKPRRRASFWNEYRATPRAYVNLAAGQKLWGSRFGKLTSIRLAPKDKAATWKRAKRPSRAACSPISTRSRPGWSSSRSRSSR